MPAFQIKSLIQADNTEIRNIASSLLTASVLVIIFFVGLMIHAGDNTRFEMPKGWEVQRGDSIYENIELDEMTEILKDVAWNESIRMSHPLNVQSHNPLTLRIYSRLSAIRVMVDKTQIYSYGYSEINEHNMVGSGYHFVLLPTSYYGKKLTIEMTASEPDALKAAPEIIITNADGAITVFAQERMLGIFSGVLLFILGLFLILLSVVAVYMDTRFYPIGFIGLFSCTAGIWCLTIIKALQLFSGDITLNSTVEYLCMYFMPIPILFLSRHFRRSASPQARRILLVTTGIATLYFGIAVILQVLRIMDVSQIVGIFHMMIIPEALILFFIGSSKWRRMKIAEKLFQIGLILIATVVVLEFFIYYLANTMYAFPPQLNNFFAPIAILTLNTVMLIGFLMEIYDMRLKDTERDRLQRLAFRDQMTGLLNRGMCEKKFNELRESGEHFTMLNMDLNGLKAVNDCYGHLMGDQYILVFSDIIEKAFGGADNLYRMGGDEFLYITSTVSAQEMRQKIELIRKLETITARDEKVPFSIDASFGIASKEDVESGDPEDVYRLADVRMYQMKKELKKERAQ